MPYEITVYTSDVSSAGTDANVFIALYGMGGVCTEQVDLTESKKKKRKECFNKGNADVFVREVCKLHLQLQEECIIKATITSNHDTVTI